MARPFLGLGQLYEIRYAGDMLFWKPKDRENQPPVIEDLRNLWSEEQPHRWKFAGIAILMTTLTTIGFAHDFHFYTPYKPPEIDWVRSLDSDRTLADVKVDQERFAEETRIEREAEEAASEERKAAYRRVAKRLGMKVIDDK